MIIFGYLYVKFHFDYQVSEEVERALAKLGPAKLNGRYGFTFYLTDAQCSIFLYDDGWSTSIVTNNSVLVPSDWKFHASTFALHNNSTEASVNY